MKKRNLLLSSLGLILASAMSDPALAKENPIYTGLFSRVALGGYDAVAYFTEAKPVKGDSRFQAEHGGAAWHFASAAHRERFLADPARYAPQYGGYCAWAVAVGKTASGDPRFWKIVGDKLYLNYDADIQKTWEADIGGYIKRADANWPAVLGR